MNTTLDAPGSVVSAPSSVAVTAPTKEEYCKSIISWSGAMAALPDERKLGQPIGRLPISDISVSSVANGKTYKAMLPNEHGQKVEGIFTVVGALGESELPPISRQCASRAQPKALTQRMTVYGYDAYTFKSALDNIEHIDFLIREAAGTVPVRSFVAPTEDDGERGRGLEGNTRYFTLSKTPIPADLKRKLNDTVDPDHALRDLQSTTMAYCADNEVLYLVLRKGQTVDPAVLKQGAIVEMGFAVNAFRHGSPQQGPQYLSKLVLRYVALLDPTLSERMAKAAQAKRKADAGSDSADARKWKSIRSASNPLAARFHARQSESESDEEVEGARMQVDELTLATWKAKKNV
uniref:Uncharacterized protein n=1 Tax=Mycena chlorophos TaxID=658473 RepID=A0ABQ0LV57_MYCCL|nr:predicted protein [Mycena chlorophos]